MRHSKSFLLVGTSYLTFGVEVAAGELARLGLGECIAELPRDLESDIMRPLKNKRLFTSNFKLFRLQGHPKRARCVYCGVCPRQCLTK